MFESILRPRGDSPTIQSQSLLSIDTMVLVGLITLTRQGNSLPQPLCLPLPPARLGAALRSPVSASVSLALYHYPLPSLFDSLPRAPLCSLAHLPPLLVSLAVVVFA